jgi:hypothetical protein
LPGLLTPPRPEHGPHSERPPLGRFRDREQAALVCRVLLGSAGLAHGWTRTGPRPDALALSCTSSAAVRRLSAACWAIWEGCTTLGFDEILAMEAEHLDLLGELLSALARGPDEVDAWLHRRRAIDA